MAIADINFRGNKVFCSNCGKEISDAAKFCRYCGAENEIDKSPVLSNEETLNHLHSKQINQVFNRDVLNNYLYNIRVLEVCNNKLMNKKNEIINRINSLGYSQVNYRKYRYDLQFSKNVWKFAGIIIIIEFLILFFAVDKFWGVILGLIMSTIIFAIILTLSSIVSQSGKKKMHMQNVIADDYRVNNELKEKENLIIYLQGLENEIEKTEYLLEDAYSVNLIPAKFRNIYAAYFLYDYISTSAATLNEALLHCDLDTIQKKLDEVIHNQEEIIIELAYNNALNERIVQQNEQILQHAIQTENNTAYAAQYTKIAANNSDVVAAIQMSKYIKQ